ncbi:cAMP-dependent protein kinase inhibitor domain-containing protein [Ditylenchus destructor]|uniref:cAMP-dependent protein kinase inhibitor domain-containing protein n=1 Tax=Ditylenchus destructor TaxID=166010 RepID=A0AAD4MXZ5_9BILA|nr:cAMP-dependent protein kinase inhibitor domain-containing protein [Ditylenchus destructor]
MEIAAVNSPTANWPSSKCLIASFDQRDDILATALVASRPSSSVSSSLSFDHSNSLPIHSTTSAQHNADPSQVPFLQELQSLNQFRLQLNLSALLASNQQQSPQEQTGTMGELDTAPPIELEQFVASGRNGRRNALADLGAAIDLDPGAYKLAEQLASLETGDQKPGCSGTGQAPANQNQASGSGQGQ